MNRAVFRFLGPIRGDDVQPFHYGMEAHWAERNATDFAPTGSAAIELRRYARSLRRIARMHAWHPKALRSTQFRERLHHEHAASRGAA